MKYISCSLAEARSKLPKAMHKSDISSTEDEYYSRLTKKRNTSLSPNMGNLKKTKSSIKIKSNTSINNSCPPRYIPEGIVVGNNFCYLLIYF